MKITKITCLISKKLNLKFDSFGVSESITAELTDGESWRDAMAALEVNLKDQVNRSFEHVEKKKRKRFIII